MQRTNISSRHRRLVPFKSDAIANMFSEGNLQPGASGPTILYLTVARTKTGLSYAKDWSADALTRICEVHGVHPGRFCRRQRDAPSYAGKVSRTTCRV